MAKREDSPRFGQVGAVRGPVGAMRRQAAPDAAHQATRPDDRHADIGIDVHHLPVADRPCIPRPLHPIRRELPGSHPGSMSVRPVVGDEVRTSGRSVHDDDLLVRRKLRDNATETRMDWSWIKQSTTARE